MTGTLIIGGNSRKKFEAELLGLMSDIRGFAGSLTREVSAADDLAQETLVRAIKHWEHYEQGTNMKAWVFMIARNLFYSEKRRSWRSQPLEQGVVERFRDNSPNQAELEELKQEFCSVAPLLGYVPMEQRDAVIAIKYVGMSYEEAATTFTSEVGTIKSRVHRGLETLRNAIADGKKNIFDLTPWGTASLFVSREDLYFPIAKAYEEIYLSLLSRPRCSLLSKSAEVVPTTLDSLWKGLVESGSLDDEGDFDDIIRYDDEPY